jgi:hypothetical protein
MIGKKVVRVDTPVSHIVFYRHEVLQRAGIGGARGRFQHVPAILGMERRDSGPIRHQDFSLCFRWHAEDTHGSAEELLHRSR